MGVQGRQRTAEDDCNLLRFPDEILKRIIDWLSHPKDRNAVSLVCKRFFSIEGPSRESVLISNCYAVQPMTLVSRFPNAHSITVKGKPRMVDYSFIPHADVWGAFATPWVELLVKYYRPLRHLKMKRMRISDADIECLVSVCGDTLERVEFPKCSGFSTTGLDSIARRCRNLVVLNICEADVKNEGAPLWLTTVATTALSLEVLDVSLTELENVEVKAVVELARRCHTLRFCEAMKIDNLLPLLDAAQKTVRHLGIGLYSDPNLETTDQIAEAFGKCKELVCLRPVWDLDERSLSIVVPIAPRIKSLDLTYCVLPQEQLADLLGLCVNLEVLQCTDIIGDRGLRQVGAHCRNLRRLLCEAYEAGFVTQHGLMAVAKRCLKLEKVTYFASDMTNQALESLAQNCPNLYDVRICLQSKRNESHPVIELEAEDATLNMGVRALLMNCPVVRRLSLGFDGWHRDGDVENVVVNDEGLRYIGQYGKSLEILTLDHVSGTTDEGLVAVAMGCHKLRKIELRCCPFGDESMLAFRYGAPSLKLLWAQGCLVELAGLKVLAEREDAVVEVVKQSADDFSDWQFIAYSSACRSQPRSDLPDNIDFVDADYSAPLSSNKAVDEEDGDQNLEQDLGDEEQNLEQNFEFVQDDLRSFTSGDCTYTVE